MHSDTMDNILTFLKQLELSEIEAKLYLTLLQHGPTSVRELAETIEIKRTTAYFYIDQLVEKGLIMKIVKGSKKLVAANPPESLQHLVEEKVKSAKEVEQKFPNILKTIATSLPQAADTNDSEIKYYKGKNGVKKIYEDVLNAKEVRSYVNIEEVLEVFPENAQLFDDTIHHNPEMKMYEIVEDSPKARERMDSSKTEGRYFYKILPGNMKIQSTDILIYDGKVGFINLKDNINGVVLHNMDLYNNLRILFDLMWKMLPE